MDCILYESRKNTFLLTTDPPRVSRDEVNCRIQTKILFKVSENLNQIAWIRRFIFNCQHKEKREKMVGNISTEEVENAEVTLIKMVQKECFHGITDKTISHFCPFFYEKGVTRIKTKITERNDTRDFIYPILLPSKHFVTEKIIMHYHLAGCHVGIQGLLCRLRKRFWIISGRRTVKKVIYRCVICRRFDSKKLTSVPVALPVDRVRDASVFEIVGVDLAGPLHLKSNIKVWVCIFTCAVYRAVHLEIVSSLSTETFLLAFRRFIARRGRPVIVYSDNGSNFVGAENSLKTIDWTWWGGWWERVIRILKNLLRRQLGKASISFEELYTIICDCEAVINSRPLTYISETSEDLLTLTPAMFLQDIRENGVPDLDNIGEVSLKRRARYLLQVREALRKRFRKEYLSQLVLFSFNRGSNRHLTDYKLGDVVIIETENLKDLTGLWAS
ncbi:hypothetical protein NQ317_000269 [Molorchus minor]|uniref:Integrase zinc-binding domain-containing protein n=1 Tax=Molorchus minor TaxID=1323400 RepID=A0ABQ9J277_9CUCU|nr:hypothetical protein NQ317_000269 [Molorchus minor]